MTRLWVENGGLTAFDTGITRPHTNIKAPKQFLNGAPPTEVVAQSTPPLAPEEARASHPSNGLNWQALEGSEVIEITDRSFGNVRLILGEDSPTTGEAIIQFPTLDHMNPINCTVRIATTTHPRNQQPSKPSVLIPHTQNPREGNALFVTVIRGQENQLPSIFPKGNFYIFPQVINIQHQKAA